MVHCLCLLYQCGLHVVPWLLIDILMHLTSAEPHNTAGLKYLTQCHYITILVTACSKVCDWRDLRARICIIQYVELSRYCPV